MCWEWIHGLGFYRHSNEPLGYIIDEEILNELMKYELGTKGPATWSYFLLLLIPPVNTQKRESFRCSVCECGNVVVAFLTFATILEDI
jgi:hypothetical protein